MEGWLSYHGKTADHLSQLLLEPRHPTDIDLN